MEIFIPEKFGNGRNQGEAVNMDQAEALRFLRHDCATIFKGTHALSVALVAPNGGKNKDLLVGVFLGDQGKMCRGMAAKLFIGLIVPEIVCAVSYQNYVRIVVNTVEAILMEISTADALNHTVCIEMPRDTPSIGKGIVFGGPTLCDRVADEKHFHVVNMRGDGCTVIQSDPFQNTAGIMAGEDQRDAIFCKGIAERVAQVKIKLLVLCGEKLFAKQAVDIQLNFLPRAMEKASVWEFV